MATVMLTPTALKSVEYPTRDGKPMAETDKHRRLMSYVIDALTVYLADRTEGYVSGNNFVFWKEGDTKARISPDGYVVFGVSPNARDSYKAWEEGGRLPSVIFEFTSKKTRHEDTDRKLPLYEQTLKTPEYFLFDPTGDYLHPRLQGYRLEGGRYVRLESVSGRLHSEQLGLDLVQDGEMLRLYDPATGEFLPTSQEQANLIREQADRLAAEARRAEEQDQRAAAAEAELVRLRAEIAALRQSNG